MRKKIDVSLVEEKTKIRAKYLRALENEEWDLLPGPSYASTFLRTYAEYLELDAQVLVDEYKRQARHEGGDQYHYDYGEPLLQERAGSPRGPRIGRGMVVGAVVLGLLAFLLVLGVTGGAEEETRPQTAAETRATPARAPATPRRATTTPAARRNRPSTVTVGVHALGDVWTCLVNDGGRRLINAETLAAGTRKGPYRSKRFKVTFGNGEVEMRVNDRALSVPELSEPVGFEVTPRGRKRLPEGERPTCGG